MGLISPDQLGGTQASRGECVAGPGYHPADVSSLCLVRLSSNLVYFFGSSFISRQGSGRLEPPLLVAILTISHCSQPAETNNQIQLILVLGCVDIGRSVVFTFLVNLTNTLA